MCRLTQTLGCLCSPWPTKVSRQYGCVVACMREWAESHLCYFTRSGLTSLNESASLQFPCDVNVLHRQSAKVSCYFQKSSQQLGLIHYHLFYGRWRGKLSSLTIDKLVLYSCAAGLTKEFLWLSVVTHFRSSSRYSWILKNCSMIQFHSSQSSHLGQL